jgi:hypothetical protein
MSVEHKSSLCYGFEVQIGSLNDKDRDLLINGIDEFELRPTDTFGPLEGPWYFGYWSPSVSDDNMAVVFDPLDLLSVQSDVDLNRKLMNYAHDLCKVSADLIPVWRVIMTVDR